MIDFIISVPVKKNNHPWLGGYILLAPIFAGDKPINAVLTIGELRCFTRFYISALVSTPTDKTSTPIYWLIKAVPTPVNFTLLPDLRLCDFGNRAVLGCFVNGKKGLLYRGEKEAIEQETRRLVAEAGSRGLILGADCTVPDDFQLKRLDWVRQAAVL